MQYMREDEEFRKLFIEEIKGLASKVNPYLMNKYRQNLSKNLGLELNSEDRMGGRGNIVLIQSRVKK